MATEEQLQLTATDLAGAFELKPVGEADMDKLRAWLAEHLRYLIDRDVGQLMQVLYRIDVNENEVKNALATLPFDESIEHVAQLIIDRQLHKVITRQQYLQPKGEW